MRAGVLVLWCLLAGFAGGQEIRLEGPESAIQPREYCQILVHGLADTDLAAAGIEWTPRAETTLIPARLWGGQPFLLFAARQPGTYTIHVTMHAWRNNLDAAVDAVRRAALIDQDLFQRLESLAADLRSRYPVRSGQVTVLVAGELPPEPQPPGPVTAADQVTIVTESTETLSVVQQEIIHGEAVRSAATAAGLEFHAVDRDIDGPDAGRVQHALAACAGQPVPRLVFSAAGQVIEHVPLPASVAETVTLIHSRGTK